MVTADTGTQPVIAGDYIESLSPISEDRNLTLTTESLRTTGSHDCPRRRMSAKGVTPMPPMIPDTTTEVSPPPSETQSAQRRPTACRIGPFPKERPICCPKPDMAQHRTSSMLERSLTLPPPIRPLSTRNRAPSSLSRSVYVGTSAATSRSIRRPRNTPPLIAARIR